jgi:hypothetical protein
MPDDQDPSRNEQVIGSIQIGGSTPVTALTRAFGRPVAARVRVEGAQVLTSQVETI